jgi:radical SAM superfamily enzyme YgiQ (UPF0313 family)
MKVLFIYPNVQGNSRLPLGLCIIMTVLEESGHDVNLFDTTFFMQDRNTDDEDKEAGGRVKPTDTSRFFHKHSLNEIDDLLRNKINDFSPDLVAFSIIEDNYEYSNRLMEFVKSIGDIPIVVGGTTPTVAPEVVVENPNIDWVMRGESERAFTEFCDLYEKGESVESVDGLVYKKEDGSVVMNSIPKFVDLNELPFPNYSQWNEGHFIKPYDGKLYKAGYIEMSRGCMFICSYCVNITYQDIMAESGKFFRSKTVDRMIEEARYQIEKHNSEMFFFCDDNFLSISMNKLKEFAKRWSEEIGLPFWINTTVESVGKEEKIRTLKEAGCAGIGLGIETGSEKLRREVLHKFIGNDKIIKTVRLLNKYDYRTTVNVIIGFPGEQIEDIYKTIRFVQDLKVPSYNMAFLSPYYATPLYEICKNLKYIEVWKKRPGFNGLAKQIGSHTGLTVGPPIKIPTIPKKVLIHFYHNFVKYVENEISIPDLDTFDAEKDHAEKMKVVKEYAKVDMLPFKLKRQYKEVVNATKDSFTHNGKRRK